MGLTKGNYYGVKCFFLYFPWSDLRDLRSKITANNASHFFMQRGSISHWLSIFCTLSKFKLCTLCDSPSNFESWPSVCEAYCLKPSSLGRIFFLFSESLLSSWRFSPVLDVILTEDWSSLTGERGNSLTGDLRCSLTGDMFSLTGDVGPFTGDVNFLCFLWDWWELHLPFLLFVVRKCTLLS